MRGARASDRQPAGGELASRPATPPIGDAGRRGLSAPARLVVDAAGYGLAAVLAGVAAARSGKAVHPHGVVHEARLLVDGAPEAPTGAELLDRPGQHRAIVRFSRSLGLPRPLPDLLGISLRVPDAYGPGRHQDVLTVSSVDLPVLHHGFVPATDVQQRPYTSALPYRAARDGCSWAWCPIPNRHGPTAATSSTGSRGQPRAAVCASAWRSPRWAGAFAGSGRCASVAGCRPSSTRSGSTRSTVAAAWPRSGC
jgi:hypothetical protein